MYRWVSLALLLALAACSDDGGGGGNIVPTLPWGGFRRNPTNAAVGNAIDRNNGTVRLLIPAPPGGMTTSTAAVDNSGNVYIGTGDGVISVNSDGKTRWQTSTCGFCDPDDGRSIPIGPVSSSPTVTPGETIVVGADASSRGPGGVFALQDNGDSVCCLWAYQPSGAGAAFGVRSSAQLQIDTFDLGLQAVFIGSGDGVFQALNRNGIPRWAVSSGGSASGPITSMPAFSTAGAFYVTTPDGLLLAVDTSGRLMWTFAIGAPPEALLQQSPAVATTAFAIGASSAVFGINPDGRLKWQYGPGAPVLGSPAFATQQVDEGPDIELDTIVYIVDVDGMLYGIRDQDGEILDIQRCSKDTEESCRTDSCLPNGGECDRQTNRCTLLPQEQCTADSCAENQGDCISEPALLPITPGSVRVETSPVVSGDFFAVVGTTDGRICARNLDGSIPEGTDEAVDPWRTGCIEVGSTCSLDPAQICQSDTCLPGEGTCVDGSCSESTETECRPDSCGEDDGACVRNPLPTRSSPSIGLNDRIFVSTDAGLYVIE